MKASNHRDQPDLPLGGAASATLDHDVICLGCGYNLRSLNIAGQCPECGQPIERSIYGDLLRYADPHWLNRVWRGVRLVYGSVVAALAAAIVALLALSAAVGGALPPRTGSFTFIDKLLSGAIALIGVPYLVLPVIYPLGWWLATAPDPAESQGRSVQRGVLRYSALLLFPAFAGWYLPRLMPWTWASSTLFVEVITHICFAIAWLHVVMMLRWLRMLHQRCKPDNAKRAAKTSRFLTKSLGYAYVLPVVALALHWGSVAILSWMRSTGAAFNSPGTSLLTMFDLGRGVGQFIIICVWLSSVGACSGVLKSVANERLVAIGLSDEKLRDQR